MLGTNRGGRRVGLQASHWLALIRLQETGFRKSMIRREGTNSIRDEGFVETKVAKDTKSLPVESVASIIFEDLSVESKLESLFKTKSKAKDIADNKDSSIIEDSLNCKSRFEDKKGKSTGRTRGARSKTKTNPKPETNMERLAMASEDVHVSCLLTLSTQTN